MHPEEERKMKAKPQIILICRLTCLVCYPWSLAEYLSWIGHKSTDTSHYKEYLSSSLLFSMSGRLFRFQLAVTSIQANWEEYFSVGLRAKETLFELNDPAPLPCRTTENGLKMTLHYHRVVQQRVGVPRVQSKEDQVRLVAPTQMALCLRPCLLPTLKGESCYAPSEPSMTRLHNEELVK